jgi:DNA-directed RNA polymerase specialized sigma24 family protein
MTDARFAEIEGQRPSLVRFALPQPRDRQLAEEAVQEALLAALESPASFAGTHLATCHPARFREAFQACLDRLPAAGGRVFFKREIAAEGTETICKEESITTSNCWVILHRARLQLRTRPRRTGSEALTYHLDR